jgi:hypothetical protein
MKATIWGDVQAEPGSSLSGVRRRRIMLSAALAPALAFSFGHSNGAATSRWDIARAVFDRRFPQSLAFAERAKGQGITQAGIAGEISTLWFDEILPALHARPMAVIGLTSIGALFCFEQMAWSIGLRVRLRIDHRKGAGGISHIPSADLPWAMRVQLEGAGEAFGGPAVDAALGCRPAWGDCTHAIVPRSAASGTDALVTWVIAPLNGL